MTFHSQAGQDAWIHVLIPEPFGAFLDVGCGHPIVTSNTFALEQLGWRGLCIDSADLGALYTAHRISPFVRADATTCDYRALLITAGRTSYLDYLSLDVDAAQITALRRILNSSLLFRAATIEHDRYRYGQPAADQIRELMTDAGYVIAHQDVSMNGLPFEDWWVEPSLAERAATLNQLAAAP